MTMLKADILASNDRGSDVLATPHHPGSDDSNGLERHPTATDMANENSLQHQQSDMEQPPMEGSNKETSGDSPDHWSKDVNQTGRWGTRNRRDVYFFIVAVLVMIGATIAGVVVAVNKSNDTDSTEPIGITKTDPITGQTISAYELPVRNETKITDQDELELILETLSKHDVLSDVIKSIPNSIEGLTSSVATSSDPYVLAAHWLTSTDTFNTLEYSVSRFALAVMYYTLDGTKWINNTNWITSEYHCDWYGIKCCENFRGSVLCGPADFGYVIEIDLFQNNLIGQIPSSLALLPRLQSLYLNDNSLTGSIPGPALGTLKEFSKLYAAYNSLTGTVPIELSYNGNFNTLFIQGNNINGTLPNELCSCPTCYDKLLYFGLDCKKINCTSTCCSHEENCYYTESTKQ